ncbi:hypothetical protein ACFYYB_09080 [Streptomyces sp. NPDC002886]|uniref:hypothetical protein n=1 Tax=Streptomyces sp. NPDC002886 TaxID=3364667 RepID=UPI0036A9ACDA
MSTPPHPDPTPPQPAYGYPPPEPLAAPVWPAPPQPPKKWPTSAKILVGVTATALVITGTALTTLALANKPETAATTTGGDKAAAPTGYRSDNLSPDEKSFMDVVFENSTKKGTLSELTAAEVAAQVAGSRLVCIQPEDKRADVILVEESRTKGREPVNKAFKDYLCKGAPVMPEAPAAATTEDPSQGHTGDVTLTPIGVKTEYGTTTFRFNWKIVNSGTQAASYFVRFEAYDKDGDFLGEDSTSAKRIGVGKSEIGEGRFYDFSVKTKDPKTVASVKIKEVTYCDENFTNSMCSVFKN